MENPYYRIVPGWFGLVNYGSHMEHFERFRFSVPTVPLGTELLCVSEQFKGKAWFWFRFRFLKNGSDGSGSRFGSRKNGFDGSGFSSGSVPVSEPPCY